MFPLLAAPLFRKVVLYGALALSVVAAIGYNYMRAEAYKARMNEAVSDAQVLAAALESQNAVAEQCDKATKKLVAIATAQQMLMDRATGQVEQLTLQLVESRQKLRTAEESDRALPQCQTLLTTDLAAICPGHAGALRMRANP